MWHQDEPLADPVCVPLHAISEAARRNGTKVVQVGEGADELFAGYTSYAFFTDFHRRLWQPYRLVPGFLRQLVARGTSSASTAPTCWTAPPRTASSSGAAPSRSTTRTRAPLRT